MEESYKVYQAFVGKIITIVAFYNPWTLGRVWWSAIGILPHFGII